MLGPICNAPFPLSMIRCQPPDQHTQQAHSQQRDIASKCELRERCDIAAAGQIAINDKLNCSQRQEQCNDCTKPAIHVVTCQEKHQEAQPTIGVCVCVYICHRAARRWLQTCLKTAGDRQGGCEYVCALIKVCAVENTEGSLMAA